MGCAESVQLLEVKKESKQKKQQYAKHDLSKYMKAINHISSAIKQVKNKNSKLQQSMYLSNFEFWSDVYKRFDAMILDYDQQLQLLQLILNFIKASIGKPTVYNYQTFIQQMGKKLDQFQKRIQKKHKLCQLLFTYTSEKDNKLSTKYFKNNFNSTSLKFDMNQTEVKGVAEVIRKFCNLNMDAFSFLTLYFTHAINRLRSKKMTFNEIQQLLILRLKQLEKIYPANTSIVEQIQPKVSFDFSFIKLQKKTDTLMFKTGPISHYNRLRQYIFLKADHARKDEIKFIQSLKQICLEKGHAFKSDLKIKSDSHNSAVDRCIQKLLENDKLKQQFQQFIKSNFLVENSQLNQQSFKQYVDAQKASIASKVQQILQKQTQIEFNIKDLLRGKAMFNDINDIVEVISKINTKLIKEGHSISEIKNRLSKNTKDVSLIINIGKSVAEFQLALQFDKVANEFNHKIYELIRSIKFTPLTNIQVINQRWSSPFFSSNLQLFWQMIDSGKAQLWQKNKQSELSKNVTFTSLKQDVRVFTQNFLENDYLGLTIIKKTDKKESIDSENIAQQVQRFDEYSKKFSKKQISSRQFGQIYLDELTKCENVRAIIILTDKFLSVKTEFTLQDIMTLQALQKLSDVCKQDKQYYQAMIYATKTYQIYRDIYGAEHKMAQQALISLQKKKQLINKKKGEQLLRNLKLGPMKTIKLS